MPGNRTAPGGDATKRDTGVDSPPQAAQSTAASGGFKTWLPLLITVVTMPVLAYVTTTFVLVPKLQGRGGGGGAEVAAHGAKSPAKGYGESKGAGESTKHTVALTKMIVNLAGTMGTRYLLTSVTLVAESEEDKASIEENRDQLLDLAAATLSRKTISDLEQPGARNQIRTELIVAFNSALGRQVVRELYFTELAVQ